jgi:methylmalonyl-CoA mutase cobalamin-binding subunit
MSKNIQSAAQDGDLRKMVAELGCMTSQVLSAVSRRIPSTAASSISRDAEAFPPEMADHLSALLEALGASEGMFQQRISRIMRLQDVSAETIVDDYIPHLAHQLGKDWDNDARSFADVTICSARLATAVRELSRGWMADGRGDWNAPRIAFILPELEQHTLGSTIVASRLRRMGVSVQVMAGRADHDVLEIINRMDFDMIAISVSTTDRLETARKLVKMLRRFAGNLPPLVCGGAFCGDEMELKAYLDVDHITSDPVEALRKCGLMGRVRGNIIDPATS